MGVFVRRGSLIVLCMMLSLLSTTFMACAATVTAVLQPGRLTITDAPSALIFTPIAACDSDWTLGASFTLGVTDATGSKAGWHIQAALGPPMRADGTPAPVLRSTITNARATGLTGVAPQATLAYPRPFLVAGDTVFSAAEQSGVGKSFLSFDTTIAVPKDPQDASSLSATLVLSIAAGP